jgi:hypothetical protein
MKKFVISTLIVVELALPVALRANPTMLVSARGGQTFSAVISSIDSKYGLTVRDSRGEPESVKLHKGTIINPTGLALRAGMPVNITGRLEGGTFDADQIDAPIAMANQPRADDRSTSPRPLTEVPTGTFQTNGPSATGGG